ncbi:MAG: hypothetical protein HQL64_03660 [Magnetococcales bacterium]|nr:hypothetical protein [Magnetococcales bacterium]
MKTCHDLLAKFIGCLLVVSSTFDCVAEEVKPKSTPDSEQEYLHFGDMGGLLPTLKENAYKDANSPGARMVVKYCGQCHNAPGPGMHTAEEWNQIFWRMIWRMQIMKVHFKSFVAPTYGESHTMFSYLTSNALQGISAGDVILQVDGAGEFIKNCAQCHRLPSPTQHEARDWKGVVDRMSGYAKNMNKALISPQEMGKVVTFLMSRGVKE